MLIRSIDFETTGIPTEADKHAVVEIGICDLEIRDDGFVWVESPQSVLCNPGRPISHEAMAVHHITDEDVADATGDLSFIGEADLYAAHHADFEQQFWTPGRPVICTWKVGLRLWPDAASHSLQFLRYHLGLKTVAIFVEAPHRAGPDAYLCALLLERIVKEQRCSIDDMVRWSSGPALLPALPAVQAQGQALGRRPDRLPALGRLQGDGHRSERPRQRQAPLEEEGGSMTTLHLMEACGENNSTRRFYCGIVGALPEGDLWIDDHPAAAFLHMHPEFAHCPGCFPGGRPVFGTPLSKLSGRPANPATTSSAALLAAGDTTDMTKFRKGDSVTLRGVIDSDFIHDDKIKVRVEPYHDIFVNVADLTMARPNIEVGDLVWIPEKDTKHAKVMAIAEDHLWVSFGDGQYATWWTGLVQRLDADPVTDERSAA